MGTFLAILIGVPVGVMTAVFLAEVAPKKLANVVRPAVELLAGIPSVIYGLLGILILSPLMYKIELAIFKGSSTHQYTGGANLISAVLVLALMILPTVINISESALRAVPLHLKSASLCSPDAYPISATIAVVRKRTELNGSGKFTELPDTSVIAIASPMALPVPRTTAVIIPDFAAGRITWKIVWI